MNRVEDKIRRYLATNLTFISRDLILVQEEYHLPNLFGTKGLPQQTI